MKAQTKRYSEYNMVIDSVVPRARHCVIPTILPLMSLKNAPSAGPRAHLENLLFFIISVYCHFLI